MKIEAFRITNFRSIIDSHWQKFSADGVTVFVGQNESGKSSVLEALSLTFSTKMLEDDDVRSNSDLPKIFLRLHIESRELDSEFEKFDPEYLLALQSTLTELNGLVTIEFGWEKKDTTSYSSYAYFAGDNFEKQFGTCVENRNKKGEAMRALAEGLMRLQNNEPLNQDQENDEFADNPLSHIVLKEITVDNILDAIWKKAPDFVLFKASSGLLPNSINIERTKYQLDGIGSVAADNFLTIADLTVKKLLDCDLRAQSNLLDRANERISKDFLEFWSQTIGKSEKLKLECKLEIHNSNAGDNVGNPYLVFWISDGFNRLYLKQRSEGVRWFISFYLQIRASVKSGKNLVFLLDEPGANLHSKAQADVLKLINQLSSKIQVVYSTHSPHMIEYTKLYRVFAAQRNNDEDDSPTKIIDAQRLGAASTDTLSPILTAMGSDLSNQQVIRKNNNVLLEEMSGFYYLKAFWKLTNCTKDAHFIAATGVNKIEGLANMFCGWGLDFIVAIDDDKQGREVFNNLKREMFGNDDELSRKKMIKIPGCKGIEDAFSHSDFARLILKDLSLLADEDNSDVIKKLGRSKPVTAYQFMLEVLNDTIVWENFDEESQKKIASIVESISNRL